MTLLRKLALGLFFAGWMSGNAFAQLDKKGPPFLEKIKSFEQYEELSGDPAIEKYGQIKSVKVMWQIKKDRVFFVSSHHYKWHYDFCKGHLGYWQSRYQFQEANYTDSDSREYVFANINFYQSLNLFTVEFSSADVVKEHLIGEFMSRIQRNFYHKDKLRLFLNTQRLVAMHQSMPEQAAYPVIKADEIYAGQIYQPLNTLKSYGYLRKIKVAELEDAMPGRRDVVVLDGPALDIPAVAGLLSPEFQTPLSHLNILCKNRKTPFLAHKSIWENPQINELQGKLVLLDVRSDTFYIKEASLEEAEAVWKKQRSGKPARLKRNLKVRALQPMSILNSRSVNLVGGKAANFAILHRVARKSKGKWKVPEGAFAIPFVHYIEHLESSGADTLITALLEDTEARSNPTLLGPRLKEIRSRIKTSAVNPLLLAKIDGHVLKNSPTLRMRFRSSTNAEDIDGFNGAGLYDSKTGIVGDTVKTVEKAIRKVWASVWNYRAFQEREYFNLIQEDVAMGVLVHRSFPNEHSNGVAITKNLYRPRYYGFVINVQAGETSVVSPPAGVTCDQLICYSETGVGFFADKSIVEYISYSSITDGKTVLTNEQVVLLTQQLSAIKKFYYWSVPGSRGNNQDFRDFALDVEFKFDGPDSTLYIKQARPYND